VGLGLTISNALAVILSGKRDDSGIHVASKFGMGSKFSFNLLKNLNPVNEEIFPPKECFIKSIEQRISDDKEDSQEIDIFPSKNLKEDARKEDLEDISIDLERLEPKMLRYKTSQKINISHLNSHSHLHNSPELNIYKKITTDSQENNSYERQIPTSIQILPEIQKCLARKSTFIDKGKSPNKENCVLIVDDNPFNLLVAENLVKETGYSVKTAIGGYEAIKMMEEFPKENKIMKAILMDCQMPIIDGYETSKILVEKMKEGKISKVPIIALTANNSEEDIKRCYNSGMVGHLTKPTSKATLTEAFSKL